MTGLHGRIQQISAEGKLATARDVRSQLVSTLTSIRPHAAGMFPPLQTFGGSNFLSEPKFLVFVHGLTSLGSAWRSRHAANDGQCFPKTIARQIGPALYFMSQILLPYPLLLLFCCMLRVPLIDRSGVLRLKMGLSV